MGKRIAFVIAAAIVVVTGTSFVAEEPPAQTAPPPLAAPREAPAPPLAIVDLSPGPKEYVLHLEHRAGKDGARILMQHEGLQIEATRIIVGTHPQGLDVVAETDGIAVTTRAITTKCKSLTLRPTQVYGRVEPLPSRMSAGSFDIRLSPPDGSARAIVAKVPGFYIELTSLVLIGEKNRLEVTLRDQMLHLKTKDPEIKCWRATVNVEPGARLNLDATTLDEKDAGNQGKIRVVQE